jgi:biopolymer transport protein ExbD
MIKVRREQIELRIEMMPLIDVIFLILTFFLYAMVLMVRVDMVPVPLEMYASGEQPDPTPAVGIVLKIDGSIHVGHDAVEMGDIESSLQTLLQTTPDTTLYLVLEEGEGQVDRGPLLTELWDRMRRAGIEIRLVGQPSDGGS